MGSASFVLFAALGGVVGGWCGVGGGGGFRHGVDDTDVDVVGGGIVVGGDVEFGLLVLWGVGVSVKFGDVDFELGVVAVLFKPFLEGADEGVVAVGSVASNEASGGVLGVRV